MDRGLEKMPRLRFRTFLHRLFPKWFPLEEVIKEQGFREVDTVITDDYVKTPFIQWKLYRKESKVEVDVIHTYISKGKEIGAVQDKVIIPYLFAWVEPTVLIIDGKAIDRTRIGEFPVFRLGQSLYDLSKIGYSDYSSMDKGKGKILDKAKTKEDIEKEYKKWLERLKEMSTDIMANARC